MSPSLKALCLGLGAWALVAVVRGVRVAEALAAGSSRETASVWLEAAVWLAPALLAGLVAVVMAARPASDVDEYLGRNVRMGVMVALFAVALSWMLVLYAAYLRGLGGG